MDVLSMTILQMDDSAGIQVPYYFCPRTIQRQTKIYLSESKRLWRPKSGDPNHDPHVTATSEGQSPESHNTDTHTHNTHNTNRSNSVRLTTRLKVDGLEVAAFVGGERRKLKTSFSFKSARNEGIAEFHECKN